MTKKDFELIAAVLRAQRPGNKGSFESLLWEAMLTAFCDTLQRHNINFKPEVYIAACHK